jgi:DNA-binding transcriptional MerR regulator
VRDMARELGLPESTVRYYRDAFAGYLPAVGTGRRRRYPVEAVPVLRVVAEGYAHNRARGEIEHALGELLGGDGTAAVAVGTRAPLTGALRHDDLLATILDGERERREVMWQMARELVRLGEAIERQQVLLAELAERVGAAGRALPAGGTAAAAGEAEGQRGLVPPASSAPPAPSDLELESLRRELAGERELVERLRRSKLDIERRAAEAEAKLGGDGESLRRRGLFGKLRPPEDDPRR